jgi:hypothetical protein
VKFKPYWAGRNSRFYKILFLGVILYV